eukprot:s2896_g2.t1
MRAAARKKCRDYSKRSSCYGVRKMRGQGKQMLLMELQSHQGMHRSFKEIYLNKQIYLRNLLVTYLYLQGMRSSFQEIYLNKQIYLRVLQVFY